MRIPATSRRNPPEAIVPMINVVFLLLVFFMMTSRIASAPPVPVTAPSAPGIADAAPADTLWITAQGDLAFGDLRGEAVWGGLAALPQGEALTLHADAALPARTLARILARIQTRLGGGTDIALVVRNR